jgi:hypothetical protein
MAFVACFLDFPSAAKPMEIHIFRPWQVTGTAANGVKLRWKAEPCSPPTYFGRRGESFWRHEK